MTILPKHGTWLIPSEQRLFGYFFTASEHTRRAPYNDTMTDTARLGVSGFTLRDFLGAGCSDLVVAAPSWVLLFVEGSNFSET
jgi:hypothetical protein